MSSPARHQSKAKLLTAAIDVVRAKGYNATRVEDVCAAAGVTKGSFFHHFKGKDELGLAAADAWRDYANELFAAAAFHQLADPLDQILGYLDLRKSMLVDEQRYCFAGTVVQEVYATHPDLLAACARSIREHVDMLRPTIAAAMEKYRVESSWSADGLACHIQVVLQGAFIVAKAQGGSQVAADSIDHLRRYVELIFDPHRAGN